MILSLTTSMLTDFPQLSLFITATIIVNLTPGADVLYVASQTIRGNKKCGIVAALGISTGLFIHVLTTALGLSELLRYSPASFFIVKILGALYLLYLGWKSINADSFSFSNMKDKEADFLKTFLKGILTTILNPKVAIFFLTFLPQFTDANKSKLSLQLFFLGGLFVLSGTIVNLGYVMSLSKVREKILNSKFLLTWIQKITGLIFGYLAFHLILAENK